MAWSYGKNRHRVELHLHLEGALRPKTLFMIAKEKSSPLGNLCPDDFESEVTYTQRGTLRKFLHCFQIFMPLLRGDKEAIKRVSYELCEDKAREGVAYMEVRYCALSFADANLTPSQVVQAVEDGLIEGGQKFGLKARQILCCLRGKAEWSMPTLELCKEFRGRSVVGIDMAGDESLPLSEEDIKTFVEAEKCGIHRTCHAGESQKAYSIKQAVDQMKTERIGHGYHVLEDEDLYQRLRQRDMHFEMCPMSSYYLCSAIPKSSEDFSKHPAIRWAADGVNFSVNTDDPGIFCTTLDEEYKVCFEKMKLNELQLAKTAFDAARSSFLPEPEKQELMGHLRGLFRGFFPGDTFNNGDATDNYWCQDDHPCQG